MVEAGIRSKLQIAQLRFNLFSNEENLAYLRNSILPSVRLQAGASWWQTIGEAELNPVPELQGRDLSAGVLISMPLFGEQFRTGNDIMIERLDRTINEATINDQFIVTVKNVLNALATISELRQRHEIAGTILGISTRDFELARLRFEVGSIGSWDMIRSKNEYYSAIDDRVSLRYSLLRQLAQVERDYPFLPEAAPDEH
jgi:outer membrane protein TolC